MCTKCRWDKSIHYKREVFAERQYKEDRHTSRKPIELFDKQKEQFIEQNRRSLPYIDNAWESSCCFWLVYQWVWEDYQAEIQ